MSCSKPLPPFVCDLLYYLNRQQLERFSIVCRPMKNFIERYFHSKPYRVFDQLRIRGRSYALLHNDVFWHPNPDDYNAQQFLAAQKCSVGESLWSDRAYYLFAEMRPYLGPTIRITVTIIFVAGNSTYNPEHIAEMESIAYIWRYGEISIWNIKNDKRRIVAKDIQPILTSPSILLCQKLDLEDANFSFKDYKVLYTVKVIEIDDIDRNYLLQFLEEPGAKPIVVLRDIRRENAVKMLDRLSKAFSSAVMPNAFKIVFVQESEPLTEFHVTNNTLGEKLELKKGLPVDYQTTLSGHYDYYSLERSRI